MRDTVLAALIALVVTLAAGGCRREARFEIVLPDIGFDLAVVALIDAEAEGSPVLDFTPLMNITDGASLSADRPADGAVRVVAFLYDSISLSTALSVRLVDLPAGVEIALADAAELPLEPRLPEGDRVSERFLPADTVTPVLPASTPGSVEERIAAAVADQLGMNAVAAQGYLPVSVTFTGSGSGSVTSDPAGIDCPDVACDASFVEGTSVTLTGTADPGSVFLGWGADCSGTAATCTVVLSNPRNVEARFETRGGLSFGTTFGGNSLEELHGLDVADDGRIALAGAFSGGEMSAGGFAATAVGGLDAWVASLTSELAFEWVVFAGDTNDQSATAVSFDDAGDVYVAGAFRVSVPFNPMSPLVANAGLDLFLVRLAAGNGAQVWGHAFGESGDQRANDVLVPPGGPVLLLGQYAGCINLDFMSCSMSSGTGTDGFLAAYDLNGNYLGSAAGGGGPTGVVRPRAVAADDAAARFVVVSLWQGDGGFGDDDISIWGGTDLNGTNDWLLRYGGATEDWPADVDLDPSSGEFAVVGHFATMTDLGTGTPLTFSDGTAFVARYDANGAALWAYGYGGTGSDEATGVRIADNGDLVVAGNFSTSVDLGCGLHTTSGGIDVFVARLSPDGLCLWSRSFGGPLNDQVTALALHPGRDVVVAGTFEGSLMLDGEIYVADSAADIFVFRLYP